MCAFVLVIVDSGVVLSERGQQVKHIEARRYKVPQALPQVFVGQHGTIVADWWRRCANETVVVAQSENAKEFGVRFL